MRSFEIPGALMDRLRLAFWSHYDLSRLVFLAKMRRATRTARRRPIVVYQPGKVGSSSIVRSLRALDLGTRIYHVHSLVPEILGPFDAWYRRTLEGPTHPARHLWEAEHLCRLLARGVREPWDIVTLVRDPLARDVSEFFQWLDRDVDRRIIEAARAGSSGALEQLSARFHDLYVADSRESFRGDLTTWFDAELKRVFGVDVYGKPFPQERGWEMYESDRARVLLIKLERLSGAVTDAFQAFLGLEGFALRSSNVRSRGDDGPLYARFRESVLLPQSYIDRMYGSRFMRHFYSAAEIAAFRRQWERVPAASVVAKA